MAGLKSIASSQVVKKNQITCVKLTEKLDDANKTIEGLLERIKLMNQRHFGSKSEKIDPDQLSLFNDMEFACEPEVVESEIKEVLAEVKPRRRGGKCVIDYSKFETLVIEHELPANTRTCPECGCELHDMKVEVTRRVRLALRTPGS